MCKKILVLGLLSIASFVHAQAKEAVPIVDVRSVVIYPKEELKKGIEGIVRADLFVDTNGNVTKLKMKETSSPSFSKALTDACSKAKFTPARGTDGNVIESWYPVALVFKPTKEQIEKANADDVVDIAELNDKMQGNAPPLLLTKKDDLIEYPMPAIRAGKEGRVELYVYVNNKGIVDSCQIISSTDQVFNDAACNTMKKMKFSPAKRGGMPVPFRYKDSIDFSLAKK
jgi:TonB family protein